MPQPRLPNAARAAGRIICSVSLALACGQTAATAKATDPPPPNEMAPMKTTVRVQPDYQNFALPAKLKSLYDQGRAAFQNKHYDVAVACYTAALAANPDPRAAALFHAERGWAYLREERSEAAFDDANAAIRLAPRFANPYFVRATVYLRRGDLNLAMEDCERGLRLNPRDRDGYLERGRVYDLQARYQRALKEYDEAIRIDPKFSEAYVDRGASYQQMGDTKHALIAYNEAIQLDPRNEPALIDRAQVYNHLGDFKRTLADMNIALRQGAIDAGDAYWLRAEAYRGLGELKKAASDFKRGEAEYAKLGNSPGAAEALNNIAWLEATSPDPSLRNGKEAVEKARRACVLMHWKNVSYVDTLAAAYAETGKFAMAVKYDEEALNDKSLPPTVRGDVVRHLALFRKHQPFRDNPALSEQAEHGSRDERSTR